MGQVWQNFQASRLTKTSLKNRNKTMLRTDLTSHKVVSLNEWLEARKAKPGGFAGANEQGRDRSEQRRKTTSAKKKFKTADEYFKGSKIPELEDQECLREVLVLRGSSDIATLARHIIEANRTRKRGASL
jgi:hypothetical protein